MNQIKKKIINKKDKQEPKQGGKELKQPKV